MARIRAYPFIHHFLGTPTDFVVHLDGGAVRHRGVGQAFWFSPRSSVLSEVPAGDQELPILLHAVTRDHQDVTVQLAVTYRFEDPSLAAARLDFALDAQGSASAAGREQVSAILTQLAQAGTGDLVAGGDLAEVLAAGTAPVRAALAPLLQDDARLHEMGIAVVGVQALRVRPDADMEKALQTPVRERAQTEADRAAYERRALAVERERTISENELESRIELARRREQLVAQEGSNARKEAEEAAAARLIEARAAAERAAIEAAAEAERVRELGQARAARDAAAMDVVRDVDPRLLHALALRDAAQNIPDLDALTITPDLLGGALAHLAGSSGPGAPRR